MAIASIQDQIQKSITIKTALLNDTTKLNLIDQCVKVITNAYRNGKKTLIAGNGGSAADAQHISGEFVSKFNFDRPGLSSIALTTNTSVLTAIGNDYGYEHIVKRQLEAFGCEGDVFIGISTSGNSKNILKALEVCRDKGIFSIAFTGEKGNKMKELSDVCIEVPSNETPRIQECHILIGHIICCIVEENLFPEFKPSND